MELRLCDTFGMLLCIHGDCKHHLKVWVYAWTCYPDAYIIGILCFAASHLDRLPIPHKKDVRLTRVGQKVLA